MFQNRNNIAGKVLKYFLIDNVKDNQSAFLISNSISRHIWNSVDKMSATFRNIYHLQSFREYNVTIDFFVPTESNTIQRAINKMVEIIETNMFAEKSHNIYINSILECNKREIITVTPRDVVAALMILTLSHSKESANGLQWVLNSNTLLHWLSSTRIPTLEENNLCLPGNDCQIETIYGHRVIMNEFMPDGMIVLGDISDIFVECHHDDIFSYTQGDNTHFIIDLQVEAYNRKPFAIFRMM
jgi:hypothetical protein